jgi:hypothetical protein
LNGGFGGEGYVYLYYLLPFASEYSVFLLIFENVNVIRVEETMILPFVLYCYETLVLTMREGYSLGILRKVCLFRLQLRDTSSRNTPSLRSEWGSSLPPDCFVCRGSISIYG